MGRKDPLQPGIGSYPTAHTADPLRAHGYAIKKQTDQGSLQKTRLNAPWRLRPQTPTRKRRKKKEMIEQSPQTGLQVPRPHTAPRVKLESAEFSAEVSECSATRCVSGRPRKSFRVTGSPRLRPPPDFLMPCFKMLIHIKGC